MDLAALQRMKREGMIENNRIYFNPWETIHEANPQAILERSEERLAVRAAMRRLPRKSSAVLALRYSGLSYAEVAGALGVSIGQVGTLLRRAEQRLRTEVTNATP